MKGVGRQRVTIRGSCTLRHERSKGWAVSGGRNHRLLGSRRGGGGDGGARAMRITVGNLYRSRGNVGKNHWNEKRDATTRSCHAQSLRNHSVTQAQQRRGGENEEKITCNGDDASQNSMCARRLFTLHHLALLAVGGRLVAVVLVHSAAGETGVVLGGAGDLAGELLEGEAFGLGDEEGGEEAEQHEEREDLQDVVEPGRLVGGGDGGVGAPGAERTDEDLGDDGADLARRGRKTVRGGAVAGGEALAGHDEGGGVGAEVEEELGQDVAGQESLLADGVVGETHDAEQDGEDGETHQLNRLATDGVDERDGNPVARDGTGTDEDEVTDGNIVVDLVHVVAARIADGREDGGVVETDAVERNVEEEPRARCSKQDLAVLPLAVVGDEVAERSLRDDDLRSRLAHGLDARDLVGDTLGGSGQVGLDVGTTLDDVPGDIEGVAGSLGDGEAVVEGDAAGDGTEADDDTPHLVDRDTAHAAAVGLGRDGAHLQGRLERALEPSRDDEGDDAGAELTETLHGEDGAHHGPAPFGGRELGSDDGGQRVVWAAGQRAVHSDVLTRSWCSSLTTTDTDTHEHTPEDDDTDDGDGGRVGGQRLGEGGEDDEDELETVHALTTDDVGQRAKTDLPQDGSTGRRDLDGGVGVGGDHAGLGGGVVPVDDTQHGGDKTDGEDVVGVGEETDASDGNGTNVVPAEGRLVDLGEGETATLVGVSDVRVVIVEVVEGSVASRSPGGHAGGGWGSEVSSEGGGD
nr:hypothetical protein CFP56_38803 [Quercus suber]